jgi:hypothetical protein
MGRNLCFLNGGERLYIHTTYVDRKKLRFADLSIYPPVEKADQILHADKALAINIKHVKHVVRHHSQLHECETSQKGTYHKDLPIVSNTTRTSSLLQLTWSFEKFFERLPSTCCRMKIASPKIRQKSLLYSS